MTKEQEQLMFDESSGQMVDKKKNMKEALDKAWDKAYERQGKSGTVMMSMRLPVDVKAQLVDLAKEKGVSQTDVVVSAVEDSVGLARAMSAVSDCLQQNPPPFVPDGWKPSSSECMTFILRAVDDAIKREEKQ